MSLSERPPILTDNHLIEIGRSSFNDYFYQARNSNVPEFFYSLSRAVSLDYFQGLSAIDCAEILLGTRFETDKQAWLGLKYAETMASIKTFNKHLENDSEGPLFNRQELNRIELLIGMSAVNESDNDEDYLVKNAVEDFFQDPMSSIRLRNIAAVLKKDIVH